MKWCLLPGLDGTGLLAQKLVRIVGPAKAISLNYPQKEFQSYSSTINFILGRLPPEPYLLIAESFSGPAALEIGGAHNQNFLRGIVVVSSFLRSPFPRPIMRLGSFFGHFIPMSRISVRLFLTGLRSPPEVVSEAKHAIDIVPKPVLAHRFQELAHVDVRPILPQIKVPLLFIQPTHDWLIPDRLYDEVEEICPSVSIRRVSGPHLLLHTQPEVIIEALREFEQNLPGNRESEANRGKTVDS